MKRLTLEELRDRLKVLQAQLPERANGGFRSLGVSEEAIADGDSQAIVEEVVRQRATSATAAADVPIGENSGKVLLLYLDENLMDGAAAVASGGFYGGLNFPPCDLWLAECSDLLPFGGAAKRALISWIPAAVISKAQAGIDVNPEECLEWAAEGAPGLCAIERS